MCCNRKFDGSFIAGYNAAKLLDEFWLMNSGVVSIWTPFGPRFFDMDETTPFDVVTELKREFDVSYEAVASWLDTIDNEGLN